jgi:hypothetical protein
MKASLAMIARADPNLVCRALDSAKHLVDCAYIVVAPDDHTTLNATEFPLPIRVLRHKWMGFGQTRTLALEFAESDPDVDMVVMVDADDWFLSGGTLPGPESNFDAWEVQIESKWEAGRWRWRRAGHLMRARKGFSWSDGVHESMSLPEGRRLGYWPGLVYTGVASGTGIVGTSRYVEDAEKLRIRLECNPGDTRAAFYYAQSLKDCGRLGESMCAYLVRADMGGWDEEVFHSLLWAAKLSEYVGCPTHATLAMYKRCAQHSPHRAEPFRELARVHRALGNDVGANKLTDEADLRPYPTDARLFIDCMAYKSVPA